MKTIVRRAVTGLAVCALVVALAFAGAMMWALQDLPLDPPSAEAAEPTIHLEASNGDSLGTVGQFRIADAPRETFSDHLVNAVLAIEDRRFYSHFGVDPRGIARAFRRNIEAGEIVEGGSTITQQLVKMLMHDDARTLTRKLREGLTAIWLERRFTKDEILTRYLNLVYMGANAHGMPAAARLYFDKDVSELSLAEAAMLAGVIRAPSVLNPLHDLEAAQRRAETVLASMVESGAIDEVSAEQARAEPAVPRPPRIAAETTTWFADWAAEQAAEVAGSFAGNLRVRTTLDADMQKAAEEAIATGLAGGNGVSEAALVAMRPDGAVVAMVGGRDYDESQFNRAVQAKRQPGSAFKLFVYLAALRNGFRIEDRIEDAPIEVDGWTPENFGGEEYGVVTLGQAFALSINRVAARLALEVGLDEVIRAARDLGLDEPLQKNPSLALGTEEVSLLHLTSAYAAVAAGAAPVEPWGVAAIGREDQSQSYSLGAPDVEQHALGPERDDLLRLLQLVVTEGTGHQAAIEGRFVAGKTGTSQEHRDAWFIGFTDGIIVGVWAGNDDGSPMDEVTGGSLPALIWKDFVTRAGPLAGTGDAVASAAQQDTLGATIFGEAAMQSCNVSACAREYRSFRASDCSYQPYDGPRQLCAIPGEGGTPLPGWPEPPPSGLLVERSVGEGVSAADLLGGAEALAPEAEPKPEPTIEPVVLGGAIPSAPAACDIAACAATYSSFDASDCTYQPYGGGPRRICDKTGGGFSEPESLPMESAQSQIPATPMPADGPIVLLPDGTPVIISSEVFNQPAACNVAACAAQYSSFDPATCTYQPFDGGPRQLCMQ